MVDSDIILKMCGPTSLNLLLDLYQQISANWEQASLILETKNFDFKSGTGLSRADAPFFISQFKLLR
jgi:hypothetical protein